MKLTYLDTREDPNFFDLLERRAVHYVSVAMPGLTFASGLVDRALAGGRQLSGEVVERRYELMSRINRAGETGTLFPTSNITLLPSPSESDRFGITSTKYVDSEYSEEELLKHFDDAFLANRQYVKSTSMYFDFRSLCVSAEYYNRILGTKLAGLDEDGLETVFAWIPDPKWEEVLKNNRR